MKFKPVYIHPAKQRFCVCHHCRDGRSSVFQLNARLFYLHSKCVACNKDNSCPVMKTISPEIQKRLTTLKKSVKEFQEHKEAVKIQKEVFLFQKDNLKDGECIILMDFAGRFLVCLDLNMTQRDFFARRGVPDMVMVLYFKVNGILHHTFVDYISKIAEKDDFLYVRSALLHLLNETTLLDNFKTVYLWSDGGPKHYKIRRTIFFLSILDNFYPQTFEWHFFPSCHGKGACDGHVGVLKQALNRSVKNGNTLYNEIDIFDFVSSCNLHTFLIDVERKPEFIGKKSKKPRSLKPEKENKEDEGSELDCTVFAAGIKFFHKFTFAGPGKIKCFRVSNSTENTLQTIRPLA
eukprot:Pompholyxophrys_punicea_v1_NODE_289_length_2364_cov_36.367259.p1 type:complete len:348 gc:universal NODE_289_length_2364_cov_36.367259:1215-172(-)